MVNSAILKNNIYFNKLNIFNHLNIYDETNNRRRKRATSSAQRRLRRRLRKRVRDLQRAGNFARARIVRRRLRASHGPP
ncbi:Hypothetical protein SRAE_2000459600 [Strongyloides ratti]|uniref:Uncharacterized protein n=1 Tax=Strongyloides ratti TaxID=34506 RepID=A0A090N026_STRRB|nr:Hypothetical protein SRAE_2000459600 [Strongyloides ratti]CEF69950.1 Hypothetical protein SRAE_2000459600 [Strongyloides ratti]